MLKIIKGDITECNTEAIVNAANTSLLGGGGVDGCIHRKAGPLLLKECRTLNGCETGEAKITKGYNLKAKYIIHTPGPVYFQKNKEQLLQNSYTNSIKLALKHNITTISFPLISTGVYGYHLDEASEIAIKVCLEYEKQFDIINIVCFGDFAYNVCKETFNKLKKNNE